MNRVFASPATQRISKAVFIREMQRDAAPDRPLTNAEIAERIRMLSPRMDHVFALLIQGRSEKEVASELGVSAHTVHEYVKALHRGFAVSSRGELLALAIRFAATKQIVGPNAVSAMLGIPPGVK